MTPIDTSAINRPTGPLSISIVQVDLAWEQPHVNLGRIEHLLVQHNAPTDVILLPEMFTTGFSMNAAKLAEKPEGPSWLWMKDLAAHRRALVGGSLIVNDGGRYYNRFYLVSPSGTTHHYDKRHTFRLAGESDHYTAGTERVVVEHNGWRLLPQVCYDLRFPAWCRNELPDGPLAYDVLLYVANWPQPRSHHWRAMLRARAIENQCYLAAVNRVGTDDKGHLYRGDSAIIDFHGDTLTEIVRGEGVETITLEPEPLVAYRTKYPFWYDADRISFLS
ncbi:MAG: amidohydrolase [Bacteroidia bacterium]|nr:amidohydrolase [Bacteroidia bacterium]